MATGVSERSQNLERGIVLEYLTIGWNVVEGIVAIASGAVSGSIALIGFGIDSAIETSSGAIVLWRLKAEGRGHDRDRIERRALRLVGASFLLLGAYIAFDSVKSLIQREAPARSVPGIIIAALSLIVMPWLARAKRHAARGLESAALQADSRQTSLCAYLSAILLVGLVLNASLGWWWADSVAALCMLPIILREARDALRGKTCADCH